MKIVHLADTHCRNLKFHEEYETIFSQIYQKIKELKPDVIVHCGDICHTKTNMSPELITIVSRFLDNLANITKTIIIAGNHDCNKKNLSRQDAISPIVETLKNKNLIYLKDAQEYHFDDMVVFNSLSIIDNKNWKSISDKSKINIALYHGAVEGAVSDAGWEMDVGEISLEKLKEFDFALLGDIHKFQFLDDQKKIAYCGSTIQQNHTEEIDKGFLFWDIKSKEDYSTRYYRFSNPKPYITLEINKITDLDNFDIPEGSRIRLLFKKYFSLADTKGIVETTKEKFKTDAITFINNYDSNNITLSENHKDLSSDNLRDITVQKELIKEFISKYDVSEELLEELYTLDLSVQQLLGTNTEDEVARGVNWSIDRIDWSNLFNYCENNKVNFHKFKHQLVGILGNNRSGKTSFINSILYTLFNSTDKNIKKNVDFINQNKNESYGKAEITINGEKYSVERASEKYEKNTQGVKTVEARTDVAFCKGDIVEDGESRGDTDKIIRNHIGTIDDFLLTSMASQHGSLEFIEKRSTGRKEILAKFLDLDILDKKFDIAKQISSDLKSELKILENNNKSFSFEDAQKEIETNDKIIDIYESKLFVLNNDVRGQEQILRENNNLLQQQNSINIEQIVADKKQYTSNKRATEETLKKTISNIANTEAEINKIKDFFAKYPVTSFEEKTETRKELEKKLNLVNNDLKLVENDLKTASKKAELLDEVPCGDAFVGCKFISDAFKAKKSIKTLQEKVETLKIDKKSLEKDLEETKKHIEQAQKVETLTKKLSMLETMLFNETSNKNNLLYSIETLENKLKTLVEQEETYNNSNIPKIKEEIEVSTNKIKEYNLKVRETLDKLNETRKKQGKLEQIVEENTRTKTRIDELREKYNIYEYYLKCFHPHGISSMILEKKLPQINEEINKILSTICDFQSFLVLDDRKLDIMIKHPKYGMRLIETGSGSEKSLVSMAIRLALIKISTLPKCDLFILDEPATDLDEESMNNFIKMLDMIKSSFSTVFLISHLDALKDTVDYTVTIQKKNGYAFIEEL
jgi:DNA repair exonuclease SbcCD ATPase subunit/DNA repair exonuclease SbcCD nuclease subunit